MGQFVTEGLYNSEVNKYTAYGSEPNLADFGMWGHFTQVVWKNTDSVGCYTADCTNSGLANAPGIPPFFTVCNYAPPGMLHQIWISGLDVWSSNVFSLQAILPDSSTSILELPSGWQPCMAIIEEFFHILCRKFDRVPNPEDFVLDRCARQALQVDLTVIYGHPASRCEEASASSTTSAYFASRSNRLEFWISGVLSPHALPTTC